MKNFFLLITLASLGLTACGPQVAERDNNGLIDAVLNGDGDGAVEQTVTVERTPQSNGPTEAPSEELLEEESADE